MGAGRHDLLILNGRLLYVNEGASFFPKTGLNSGRSWKMPITARAHLDRSHLV